MKKCNLGVPWGCHLSSLLLLRSLLLLLSLSLFLLVLLPLLLLLLPLLLLLLLLLRWKRHHLGRICRLSPVGPCSRGEPKKRRLPVRVQL